jgi:methylated-DNA-[protein]-cysteine S-methyltransferase
MDHVNEHLILRDGALDRYVSVMPSPIGQIWLYSDGQSLTGLYLEREGEVPRDTGLARENEPFRTVRTQLEQYFAGELRAFSVPLAPRGTPFQRTVWQELLRIPCGETRSYGEVAAAIGRPTASRAVGMANGGNPISLIIPCHRVIGQDGSLTGYGWGLPRKRWLLAHEAQMCHQG